MSSVGWTASDEVDVSSWAVIRDEPGGRDPNKRWVAPDPDSPRHEQWLWKSRQSTGDGSEFALTDCAEVVASRLALLLRLPAAECRFAVCDGEWGVVSRNVAPAGYSLNTARTYLPEVEDYVRVEPGTSASGPVGSMRADHGYTLDAVEAVLGSVLPPPGTPGSTAMGVFAGYLVLDALIGNGDRHPGNWALLESRTGERFLAPTYDHGSALGAGLTARNRETRDPVAFARRGRSNPFGRRSLVSLAHEGVARASATHWIAQAGAMDEAAIRTTTVTPEGRMSEVAANFVVHVILENRRRLCDDDAAED